MSMTEPAAPDVLIPARGKQTPWTEERAERAKKLWEDGLSATAIMLDLNCGLTRNAVIGKLMRMGLRREGPRSGRTRVYPVKKRTGDWMKAQALERRKELWAQTTEITDLPVDTGDNPTKLVDTHDDQCRWPVTGDGADMVCCGGEAFQNLPYCVRHCRMAYER